MKYLPQDAFLAPAKAAMTGVLAELFQALGEAKGTPTLTLENLAAAENGELAMIDDPRKVRERKGHH